MSYKFKDYRQESSKVWGTNDSPPDQELDRAQITLGAVLRIADSLEALEKTIRLQNSGKEARINFLERKVKRLESSNKKIKEQRDYYFKEGGKTV